MNLAYIECPSGCCEEQLCNDCYYLQSLQEELREPYYADYETYRRTILWKKTSELVKIRYGNCCANLDCVRIVSPLIAHHEIYPSQWGTEKLGDMVCLCQNCHDQLHGHSTED